jgi:hypothetical protein
MQRWAARSACLTLPASRSTACRCFFVDGIPVKRLGDVLDNFENNVAIGIFYVKAWDSRILIGLDHNFILAKATDSTRFTSMKP